MNQEIIKLLDEVAAHIAAEGKLTYGEYVDKFRDRAEIIKENLKNC